MSPHAFSSPPTITALSDGYDSYINSVVLDTVATLPPTAAEATAKMISVVICVKVTATLSMIGSAYIAQEVLRDRKKRTTVYHRLLLAFSISDISGSMCMFIGSWAIPKGTDGIFMARGNDMTCQIQGMFVQLMVMTPMLNLCLSIYYLLSIKYGYKERRLKKVEPYFYVATLSWGFGTAITGFVYDSYSSANLWCWFGASDYRGRFGFFYGPVWAFLFLLLCIMVIIYLHIREREKAVEKYDFAKTTMRQGACIFQLQAQKEMEKHKTKHSKKVAIQSFWFVGCAILANFFSTIIRVIQLVPGAETPYTILLLFSIFTPMQGFMNFYVHMRPRLLLYYKKKNKNKKKKNPSSLTSFRYKISGHDGKGSRGTQRLTTANFGSSGKSKSNNNGETEPDNEEIEKQARKQTLSTEIETFLIEGPEKNAQKDTLSTEIETFRNEETEKNAPEEILAGRTETYEISKMEMVSDDETSSMSVTKTETYEISKVEMVSDDEISLMSEEDRHYYQQPIAFDLPYNNETSSMSMSKVDRKYYQQPIPFDVPYNDEDDDLSLMYFL